MTYDLIVIGAGPGGYPAALKAASMGKRVAVVEHGELGGTCLNRGCIPTKTLLHTTQLFREMKQGEVLGLEASCVNVNGEKLKARKEQVVQTLREGILARFKKSGIVVYQGTGMIEGEHRVSVRQQAADDLYLEGESILIASGSRPALLPIPGIELSGVVTSDEMLEQVDVSCRHLIIIGGGVIGMEFAQIYSDLGCRVTVLEAMDRILFAMDKEIAQNLKMIMKKRGVEIHSGAMLKEIRSEDEGLVCVYEEKGAVQEVCGDKVLIATGRKPNTEGLFGEKIGSQVTRNRGYLSVDETYCIGIPGIYAIGDVIGGIQLAHAATAEGINAVGAIFNMEPCFDMNVVPSCIYTDPEIAVVGIDAEQAKEMGMETRSGKYIMSVNGKSVLSAQERGFIKLLEDRSTGRIVGAQLMCARATDMIGELALAISKGLTIADLAAVIMPHPTFAEGIGEAAEALLADSKKGY